MPKKPLNIRIDETLLGQLKSLAEENQTSLTNVIESFCQYGLQQDIEISKDCVSINVNTIDEGQLQQRIQKVIDTTVETKVKKVEDRLDAAIAPVLKRLESLELQQEQSKENGLQRMEEAGNISKDGSADKGGLEGKYEDDGVKEQVAVPVYGYDAALQVIKQLLTQGKSQKQIAEHLNQQGYATKTGAGQWDQPRVSRAVKELRLSGK